jgi:hypothetical protein
MEKRLLLGVVVLVVLCGSVAFALDPMGPPTAGLEQGQWSAGLDYAFSEADHDWDGEFDWETYIYIPYYYIGYGYFDMTGVPDKLTFENVEMHKGFLTIGYGITDNWEAFFRLGAARAETQKPTREIYTDGLWIGEDGVVHDFDTGFAIGFGTKVTLWKPSPDLKIGGLFQASWTELDVRPKYQGMSEMYMDGPPPIASGVWSAPSEGELEFWEMQLAIGATYELSPKFKVYGGPFFYWLDGEYTFKGQGMYMGIIDPYDPSPGPPIMGFLDIEGCYDVENDSEFGGYLGAQIELTDNAAWNAECQLTGDAYAFGTGLAWRF